MQEPGLELRQARAAEHERRHPAEFARDGQARQEELGPAEAEQQRGHEERPRAEKEEVQARDDRADGADEVLCRGVGRRVLAEGDPGRQVAGDVGDQREVEQHPHAKHEQGGNVAPRGGGGRSGLGNGPGHGWCLEHRNGKRRNRKPKHSKRRARERRRVVDGSCGGKGSGL